GARPPRRRPWNVRQRSSALAYRGPIAGGTERATMQAMPARAIDTASLSFGLVTIPVKIYSTNEPSHHISFNLLHAGCGQRLHQKYVCPKHGEVTRDEMIKGYEYAKNKYVELSADELKALDAVASDAIELREFVPAMAIDPLYVDHSYYLG